MLKTRADVIFSSHKLGVMINSRILELELTPLSGIIDVDVSNVSDSIRVEFDTSEVTSDDFRTFLKKLSQATESGTAR